MTKILICDTSFKATKLLEKILVKLPQISEIVVAHKIVEVQKVLKANQIQVVFLSLDFAQVIKKNLARLIWESTSYFVAAASGEPISLTRTPADIRWNCAQYRHRSGVSDRVGSPENRFGTQNS